MSDILKKYKKELLDGKTIEGIKLDRNQKAYREGFLEVKCKSVSWDELKKKYDKALSDITRSYYSGAMARYKRYLDSLNNISSKKKKSSRSLKKNKIKIKRC